MPAKYELDKVKMLVEDWTNGNNDKLFFSPKRKSVSAVSHVCGVDRTTATEIVADGILQLDSSGFYEQRYLSGRSAVADVYGLENYRDQNWYVKFYIDSDEDMEFLESISFHPLDEDMKCESGKFIKNNYKGDRPWKD